MQARDTDVENRLNCLEPLQLAELLDFVLPNRLLNESDNGPVDSGQGAENSLKH